MYCRQVTRLWLWTYEFAKWGKSRLYLMSLLGRHHRWPHKILMQNPRYSFNKHSLENLTWIKHCPVPKQRTKIKGASFLSSARLISENSQAKLSALSVFGTFHLSILQCCFSLYPYKTYSCSLYYKRLLCIRLPAPWSKPLGEAAHGTFVVWK